MIRSNLLTRRVATGMASKQAGRCIAPSAASNSAIDALVTNGASLGSSSFPIISPSTSLTLPSRHFSADVATELGSILQREINEETEAAADYAGGLPSELAELDAEIRAKWTVLEGISGIGNIVGSGETGSGATMRMFRKEAGSKGAKIGIVFHCQDTEEDVRFDENQLFGEQPVGDSGNEEDGEEPGQAVRFGVTVSKGGKTVVVQCRADSDGDINVETVVVRDGDAESVLAALAGGENMHAALYQGPDFTELSEDLQESFQNYVVKECGVDVDVVAYIAMYSDYREQEEYVEWMKTAIDILD